MNPKVVEVLAAGHPSTAPNANKGIVASLSFDLLIENEWIATTRDIGLGVTQFQLHKIGTLFGKEIQEAGYQHYDLTNKDYILAFGNKFRWVTENGGPSRWRDSIRSKYDPTYQKNALRVDPNDLYAILNGIEGALK